MTAAYRELVLRRPGSATAVATARAGNVIGGGDWGEDRLVPDLMRGALAGAGGARSATRDAIRPWQHVLNPLSGYLLLAEALWESPDVRRRLELRPRRARRARRCAIVDRLSALWAAGSLGAGRGRAPARAALPAARLLQGARAAGLGAALGPRPGAREHRRLARRLRAGEDARALTLKQVEAFTTGTAP